jgi:hypothetical protein
MMELVIDEIDSELSEKFRGRASGRVGGERDFGSMATSAES